MTSRIWGKPDGPVRLERPARVVRDLPGMAVGVGERARVAAPEGLAHLAGDARSRAARLLHHPVDLGRRADVVRKGDTAESAPVLDTAVGRELLPAPERENHPARLKEDDVVLGTRIRVPAEPLVEPPRPREIVNAERDQADPLLHPPKLRRTPEQ